MSSNKIYQFDSADIVLKTGFPRMENLLSLPLYIPVLKHEMK